MTAESQPDEDLYNIFYKVTKDKWMTDPNKVFGISFFITLFKYSSYHQIIYEINWFPCQWITSELN